MQQTQIDFTEHPENPRPAKTEQPIVFSCQNLSFQYGTLEVLRNVSFDVRKGELLGILGPNGAGKTTAFQILTGILPAPSGTFSFEGNVINPLHPEHRREFGIVFQQPGLDVKLTAIENLLLTAQMYNVSRKQARKRAEDLLDFMGLADRKKDYVDTFSGGMKRRLEIIRALIHQPKILILDEPTTGLDENAFRKIWQRLLDLKEHAQIALLLTTHRADEADQCDRIVLLHEGQKIVEGTPESLKGEIGGDILALETNQPQDTATEIESIFKLKGRIMQNKIILEISNAHEMIPKIVEHFPKSTFQAIHIHRPTLGDVFVKHTGQSL